MKIRIDVKNRAEGKAIELALRNPEVRAFVVAMGTLAQLPSDRARERVLRFVDDKFDEENAQYISVFGRP